MLYGLKKIQYDQIVKLFSKYGEIDSVILYGSRAKGSHKPYSDIDITLVGPALNLGLLQKIEIELDDLMLPYKFDVSIFSTIDNKDLLEHIKRVGTIIYNKKTTL
jgi:type I restriction enzyme S subunit